MADINLKGMGVALITPFKEDESVDYEALGKLVDYQVQNGTDYLVVLGTTAETPTLTEEEKKNRPRITKALLKRIFSYLLPYWPQLLLVLAAIILSSVFGLLPSILTGKIIDEGLIGKNFSMLLRLIGLSFAGNF